MFRFDASMGYYLYPEVEGKEDLPLWLNKGSTYEKNVALREDICIIKHGLKIPVNAEDYDEFKQKIKKSEQEFFIKLSKNSWSEYDERHNDIVSV
jgi:hypothetical protein